jgi:hypothetical protein
MPRGKKTQVIAPVEDSKEELVKSEPESDTSSSSSSPDVIEKPKRQLTEKQKEAFEKAKLKRQENILFRKAEKEKQQAEYNKLLDAKKAKKEAKLKKKQDLELKKADTDSDSSESIVLISKKKKKANKKKIIHVYDDEDEKQDNNIVIINKMESQKPKQPVGRPRSVGVFC